VPQRQYTMVFKTIKFDENWTYGPAGENVVYTSDPEKVAHMWVMTEGPGGGNVGYEFVFPQKKIIVGVSFFSNLVAIPLSDTDVIIPHAP
jgi:hypothetical protein